jgi:two-component system, cell cycle sensor histidine kinase and response regulator CckA
MTSRDGDDRQSRAELLDPADFFEISLDNLCIVDFDGNFLRVNPSWTRTLGWTEAELLARPSIELVHPDDRERTLTARHTLHGGSSIGALRNRYVCKDGSYRWFEWRSIADLDRRLVFAAARDVTEQLATEERLRESMVHQAKLEQQVRLADRMAAVGTLAAGSAHEINNPLTAVLTNAAMLTGELQSLSAVLAPAQLAELVEMAGEIRAGADRIRTIVRGLSSFARADEQRPAVVDVRRALEQAISLTGNEIQFRARLETELGATPRVLANEASLVQVFVDLLVNAAQAMPEGASGANEIRVVTSTDPRGHALIEIRDTGQGIPASIIDRVFDPFFTTKPVGVGTGLGLSVCYNSINAIGGTLSVESEPGRGTTFRITLPPAPAAPVAARESETRPPPDLVRGTVLVIDDEPALGTILARVLADHEVTVTTSARQALELIAGGASFDVILSDLMMPEMSGMELYDQLSLRFPEAARRVVFVSGGAFTQGAREFLERVDNLRIDKPFEPRAIRAIVQQMIDEPPR